MWRRSARCGFAGCNAIDRDVVASHLVGEAAGEVHRPGLRRRVDVIFPASTSRTALAKASSRRKPRSSFRPTSRPLPPMRVPHKAATRSPRWSGSTGRLWPRLLAIRASSSSRFWRCCRRRAAKGRRRARRIVGTRCAEREGSPLLQGLSRLRRGVVAGVHRRGVQGDVDKGVRRSKGYIYCGVASKLNSLV